MFLKKGFTIIEITMAIFVMAVGIIGIYALIPRIISVTSINTNRFIASQLAGEAIEITRNIRDSNWIKETEWNEGMTNCLAGCEIDYNDNSFLVYQSRFLKIDSQGFYNYEIGEETKFKRKITIIEEDDILNVQVEVSWPGKYSPFTSQEKLYNWR